MRIAELTKKAAFKAITESKKLYLQACAFESMVRDTRRVCTRAEWRYRLCGITVAPMIPRMM